MIVKSFSIKGRLTKESFMMSIHESVGPCLYKRNAIEKRRFTVQLHIRVYKYHVLNKIHFVLCPLYSAGAAVTQTNASPLLTFVVFTLFPEMQDQPVRSGRTRHSSPSRHGSILHHHFWRTMDAREKYITAEGHFLDGRT